MNNTNQNVVKEFSVDAKEISHLIVFENFFEINSFIESKTDSPLVNLSLIIGNYFSVAADGINSPTYYTTIADLIEEGGMIKVPKTPFTMSIVILNLRNGRN